MPRKKGSKDRYPRKTKELSKVFGDLQKDVNEIYQQLHNLDMKLNYHKNKYRRSSMLKHGSNDRSK